MAYDKISKPLASLLGSLLIAFSIMVAGYLARPFAGNADDSNLITVQQIAQRDVKADYAQCRFAFVNLGKDAVEVGRQSEAARQLVAKFIVDNGISETGVQFSLSVIDLAAQAGVETMAEGPSLRIQQAVTVSSSDVDKVRALAQKMGELSAAGIKLLPSDQGLLTVTYQLLHYEEAKRQLLDDTIKASRQQAEQISAALGRQVVDYNAISPNLYSVFDSGQTNAITYDAAIVKTVQLDASVTFKTK